MTPSLASIRVDGPVLDDLVEQLTERFRVGDESGIERLLSAHPDHADRLRGLLPALEMMDGLGESASAPPSSPRAFAIDPTGGLGTLGDFRILREVGRGGMGVVYEAEQISLGRRVALKVLPFAAAMDPSHLARFRVETQAAALLHHAHIVPIHAVGCERGVHYYAMQFVEGRTLAEWIAELRQIDPPRTASSTSSSRKGADHARTAARLGVQAAEALEHAHDLGVIHRDIKPANLLVDARGHLWVADFGLARLGGDSGVTRTDNLVGTLRYMTPEQAQGRRVAVDGRADVYALGVTLYEFLTLRPAFEGREKRAILKQVAFDEPRPPRSLDPAIPRDLETIVLKAMSKEPESRYATAKDLADDLRRFLDDRPVRARRPSLIGHLARWSRRHRSAVASTATVLFLAVATSGFLLWRENGKTAEALREARSARDREREALRFTFAGSDLIASRALRKIGPDIPPDGPDADFCRRALGYYEEIARRYRDDPEMRNLAAAAEHRVGFIRRILGLPGAEAAMRRSIRLYESGIPAVPSDRSSRVELSVACEDLADLLARTRGLAASEPMRRLALEVRQALAAEFPEDRGYRISVSLTLACYANLLQELGNLPAADLARIDLSERSDSAIGLAPGDAVARNVLAWNLALNPGSSPRVYLRASSLAKEAVAIAPSEGRFANTLGVASYRAGEDASAIDALRASMRLRGGGDAYDWLFLAMAEHRLGHHSSSCEFLARSLASIRDAHPTDADLIRIRDEATSLIGD